MASDPHSKTCLFCGRPGPFNDEHVWARWLWKHLFGPDESAVIVKGFVDASGETSSTKPYNKDLNLITRQVCVRCNGGWMRRLEDQVESMVTLPNPNPGNASILQGAAVDLRPKGRNLLARWALKTAMTRDSADPPERRIIAPEICRELCQRHGRPPSLTLVFLGWYLGETRIASWGRLLAPKVRVGMNLDPKGFAVTFSVGQIVFQVVRVNEQADCASTMRTAHELNLVRIWPNRKDRVIWPPFRYHTDQTLRSFAVRQVWW